MTRRAALLLCLAVLLGTGVRTAGGDPELDRGEPMERLIERCALDEQALERFYAVPLSTARAERLASFAATWQARLAAVDFDALDVHGRVDYLLLRTHLARRASGARLAAQRRAEMASLLPFADALVGLEERRRRIGPDAHAPLEPRAAADVLHAAVAQVKDARARCEKAKQDEGGAPAPTAVVAFRASRAVDDLRRMLSHWFAHRDGYEPDFGWWVRAPKRALDEALSGYAKFLREKVAGVEDAKTAPLIGDPIGREALLESLAHEFIPYGPEQLLAVAEAEFAWCEARGAECAKELGCGTWAAAVEKTKARHAPPGAQDDLVGGQAEEAIRFLAERDLVTVPPLCAETWRLEMISEEGQKTLPFAVYNDQQMLVAYATEGMAHDTKLMSMRGNNEHFTRIVTPHELIPGHHLQLFMAARHRPYRSLFRTPFLVEGWALHWEMLLWDLGWARDAFDRVGMLFWRMHRCARIIVTLRFHLGQMTTDAMVDFLAGRVGLERDGATSEVRRYVAGAYGPLYQCAYMLGGLQLRALHAELVGGGRMTQRAFHDAVLRQNSIPVEMIRAALTGQSLRRDHVASWAFRGAVSSEEK